MSIFIHRAEYASKLLAVDPSNPDAVIKAFKAKIDDQGRYNGATETLKWATRQWAKDVLELLEAPEAGIGKQEPYWERARTNTWYLYDTPGNTLRERLARWPVAWIDGPSMFGWHGGIGRSSDATFHGKTIPQVKRQIEAALDKAVEPS